MLLYIQVGQETLKYDGVSSWHAFGVCILLLGLVRLIWHGASLTRRFVYSIPLLIGLYALLLFVASSLGYPIAPEYYLSYFIEIALVPFFGAVCVYVVGSLAWHLMRPKDAGQ